MSHRPLEDSIAQPVGTTLERYIMRTQSEFPYATGELSQLLRDIALAGKIVSREINRAGLAEVAGAFGQQNVQGEQQQKLDVVANIRFIRALKNGGQACAVLSEEEDEIVHTGNVQGKYVVAIDPLDGSSNIDVNVSIGTIFSIYRRVSPYGAPATEVDFLQGGRRQIAAGYILYGSSTMLVYTTGHGVVGFTYESSLGEFFLSHPRMIIPETGNIFSCNEGNWHDYPEYVRDYLTRCKERRCSGRYVGSLVADYHRNLLVGGIYLYPPTQKNPDGKLRLLYESFPLAFVIEQAGGRAEAGPGRGRVMDLIPTHFHQRTPLFTGSYSLVDELLGMETT